MTAQKNHPTNFLPFIFFFITILGFGQQKIYDVTFETASGYTTSVAEYTDGDEDYFVRTDGSNIASSVVFNNQQGSYYFGVHDTNGDGGPTILSLYLNSINISGYTSLEFRIHIAEDDDVSNQDWDGDSYMHVTGVIDSGSTQNLIWVEASGGTNTEPKIDDNFDGTGNGLAITDTFVQFTSNISGSGNLLDIQIEFKDLESGDEDIAIDNIEIWGIGSSPTITVGSNISGLDYTFNSGPSAEQTTTVSGVNLTNDIVLTAPTNFEISTISGSGFGSAINLTPSSGTVSTTTIYTRLQSGLAVNSYSDTMSVTSIGATSQNISLSGDVTLATVTCVDENFNSFTGTPPSGWSGSGLGNYTSIGSSGVAPNSVQFNSTNDYLETPTLVSPNSLSFWIKGNGTDASSALLVEGWDGSSWNTIENINPISTTEETKTYSSGLSSYTKFRFTYSKSSGNVAFDDVKVICDDPCASAQTVTGFTPSSGPENTEVTIVGTGFTGSTTVTLGGTSLNISSQTTTELKVTIPSGSSTGGFTVSESSCDIVTSDFTIIDDDNTTCDGMVSASELFISEVTDATTGSLTYIEIYNGTGSDIADLSIYSLKIRFNAGATTSTIVLSGSVTNDDVFVVSTKLDTTCPVPGGDGTFADQNASTINGIDVGVNSSDCITLIKSGTDIDVWGDCADDNWRVNLGLAIGVKGFNFQRLSSATLPSIIFSETDWNITDFVDSPTCSENYDNVGSYSLSTLPNLVSQSNNPPSCTANAVFYVTGNEGYNEAGDLKELTYQWYEVAPGTANWIALTDGGIYGGTATNTLTISDTSTLDGYQYYCQIREDDATCFVASDAVIVSNTTDTVSWNGSWSNGSGPTSSSIVTLNSDYVTSSNGSFECCSLTLSSNVTLDIDATFVSVENDLIINNDAELNVETDASLIMVYDDGDVTLNGTGMINVNKTTFTLRTI